MKKIVGIAILFLCALVMFSSCAKQDGGSASEPNMRTVTLMVGKDDDLTGAEAVFKAIEEKLSIKTEIEIRMGGIEGDNVVKTRLASGDMTDIMMYNTGSKFMELNPEQYFLDLTNESYMPSITDDFKSSVTVNNKSYAIPMASTMAGAILYNKTVYQELGLSVPHTWEEFLANCDVIQAAGKTAVLGSLKDTWTSQIYFLGDEYNVKADYPNWPQDYTNNKAKYATNPAALRGFQKTADVAPYLNRDAISMTFDQAIEKLVSGEGAHWAILTMALGNIAALYPDEVNNIGVFGVPGDDPNNHGLTVWTSFGYYLNKDSPNLEAAKEWAEFYVSEEGLRIYSQIAQPFGPFSIKGVPLPDTVYAGVKDMQVYFDEGKIDVALEFESPVKGTILEQILIEVMTGNTSPEDGAAAYDQEVVKQAIQLGLPGWN
jgi:raffinose/stachyose/melibiose transport system substrate-binding protein